MSGFLHPHPPQDGPQNIILSRFLDTNGDGTGTKNANGDYSDPADIFYLQPAAGKVIRLNRMIIHYEDTQGMTATEYGNLGAALTNGIVVRIQDDSGTISDLTDGVPTNGIVVRIQDDSGTISDLTDGVPVKTNADWSRFCYDAQLSVWVSSGAPTNDVAQVRWTFGKSGTMIRLDGDANERLEVVLSDSFTGLIDQYFMVQGYTERNAT
jgi:hypothetical protein